jgi:hypothetical protein
VCCFAGQWEGVGTYRFSDGTVYEGQFVANRHHGRGTITYSSGSSYEGQWRAGQKHGTGTYRWADGRVEVGFYHNDSSVGEGAMWSSDQRTAWRIVDDGKYVEEISLAAARAIAEKIGEPVPYESFTARGAKPTRGMLS